ncbi:MAG: AI-2E family transporter [Patescibacteria group bacterium]
MFSIFKPKHAVTVDPSIVIFSVFFLITLYLLFYIRSIVLLVFLAFVLMTALHPSVLFLQRRLKFPKSLAIVSVYVLLVFVLSLAIAVIIPPLVNELQVLIESNSVPFLQPIQNEIKSFRFSLMEVGTLLNSLGDSLTTVVNIASSAFSGIFTFFTLIVLSFYMLIDRDNLYKRVAWFSKNKKHLEMAKNFVDRVEDQLGAWVRGQSILMITIGVVTYIGLTLLSVPYALPLAILAGLLEVLPNLGPTIAAIPAVILALLTGSPLMAGLVTLFYIVVQQLENNFIVPKIMKDNVDVSPLATIITILIGLKVYGVFGALLSVPIYIIFRALYHMWMTEYRT